MLFFFSFLIVPLISSLENTDVCVGAHQSVLDFSAVKCYSCCVHKLHVVLKTLQVVGKDKTGICLVKEASYANLVELWVLEPT